MRLLLAAVTATVFVLPSIAHDSWISKGGHRNSAGEWCCGEGDCFIVPKEMVHMNGRGYELRYAPKTGVGPSSSEQVPFVEAQPSPDGEFWRCHRIDGTRRCFFAPPPAM